MTKLFASTSMGAVALVLCAGVATAQSSMPNPDNPRITCSDLGEMDGDRTERVIYFLAGWQAAQVSSTIAPAGSSVVGQVDSGAGGSASAAGEDTVSATEDTTASVSADTTAATGGSASTESGAMASMTASKDTQATASTSTDTGAMASGGGSAAADNASGASIMASVESWDEIDVEQIASACEGNADMQILDLLERRGVMEQ